MLLFRRLQAGAVDPFVEILDHAFMARTVRRRRVLRRVRKLDILLHRLSPLRLEYPVLAEREMNKLLFLFMYSAHLGYDECFMEPKPPAQN